MKKDFIFKNTKYTTETFMQTFGIPDTETADKIINQLYEKGLAKDADLTLNSEQQKAFDKFIRENMAQEQADEIRAEEERSEECINNTKRENIPKYPYVKYSFTNFYDAQKFMKSVYEIGIPKENCRIEVQGTSTKLVIDDVTQSEVTTINVMYNSQKFVSTTTRAVDKTARAATNIIEYTAHNIGVPLVKTGTKAAGNLLKGLISTAVKAGSSIASVGVDTIKETAKSLSEDTDIKKAKGDFISAKDSVRNTISNINIGSSGIEYGN